MWFDRFSNWQIFDRLGKVLQKLFQLAPSTEFPGAFRPIIIRGAIIIIMIIIIIIIGKSGSAIICNQFEAREQWDVIKCITEQDNWIVFLKEFYSVLCLSKSRNCVQLWSWKSGIRTGIVCNRRNCAIVCTLHRNGVCACGFHGQPPLHLLVSIVQSFCPTNPPDSRTTFKHHSNFPFLINLIGSHGNQILIAFISLNFQFPTILFNDIPPLIPFHTFLYFFPWI